MSVFGRVEAIRAAEAIVDEASVSYRPIHSEVRRSNVISAVLNVSGSKSREISAVLMTHPAGINDGRY